MNKLKISETVSSTQELRALILELEQYRQWFRHAELKKRVNKKANVGNQPQLSESAREVISLYGAGQAISIDSLDLLLSELGSILSKDKKIRVTLAAQPNESLKQIITKWCRDNLTGDLLIDYRFNSTILGGMIIEVGSHIYDWSFKRDILAAQPKLAEAISRV